MTARLPLLPHVSQHVSDLFDALLDRLDHLAHPSHPTASSAVATPALDIHTLDAQTLAAPAAAEPTTTTASPVVAPTVAPAGQTYTFALSGSGYDFPMTLTAGADTLKVTPGTAGPFGGTVIVDAGAGNDLIDVSTGKLNAQGGEGNDTVLGSASADTIIGGGGDDELHGRGGGDHLTGGAGADTFIFHKGEVQGAVIEDFSGLAGDGDRIVFAGAEPGSTFGGWDHSWHVRWADGTSESFTLTHGWTDWTHGIYDFSFH